MESRLFGSQRALKTVEDFTEFEQRAAYFDGDHVMAAKKGVNVLERGSQVHFMSEFMAILDFPPAPKLDIYGELDAAMASPSETRGQALFVGKAQCSKCHPSPYYTDNDMHNLRAERFYKQVLVGGINELKQFDLATQWPLTPQWTFLGRWNYSLVESKTLEALAGVEYNADCWVLRAVVHRLTTTTEQATTAVYLQLELTGLARIGTNPLDLLRRSVPGFLRSNDPARQVRGTGIDPYPEF